MLDASLTLRPATDDDLPFLCELYSSTRQEELAAVPWTEEEKRAFLKMQFEAQHVYYRQQFPQASFDVIVREGRAIGRLYVDRRSDEIRLVDIALTPEFRNRGIGGRLLDELLKEARRIGKPVRIHVEKFNPALRLYQRLGFRQLRDSGVYWLMEWKP